MMTGRSGDLTKLLMMVVNTKILNLGYDELSLYVFMLPSNIQCIFYSLTMLG